ncbi:MAG: hypothetical protein ABSC90_06845 [Acidimicrobiales bacterium]|jgi:hypothetical protein
MERGASSGRQGGHGRGGRGRPAGGTVEEKPSVEGLKGWLAGRLPDAWFENAPSVVVDRDEILVVGRVASPEVPDDTDEADRSAAELGRISRFREETREERMAVARQAEHLFGRSIAWGAEVGSTSVVFTNLSVPVMTRLRQPERMVLDTLVDSGVARSRADALAWCVKLVGANADDWLRDLRAAMESVETVRQQGPTVA